MKYRTIDEAVNAGANKGIVYGSIAGTVLGLGATAVLHGTAPYENPVALTMLGFISGTCYGALGGIAVSYVRYRAAERKHE